MPGIVTGVRGPDAADSLFFSGAKPPWPAARGCRAGEPYIAYAPKPKIYIQMNNMDIPSYSFQGGLPSL